MSRSAYAIEGSSRRFGPILIIVLLVLLFGGARMIATFVIDWQWWSEMGQFETWMQMLSYGVAPGLAAGLLSFAVLWSAHAWAVRTSGGRLRDYPTYAKASVLVLLVLAFMVTAVSFDSWDVIRFAGGHGIGASSWRDPVFNHDLAFYFFDLPFYRTLLRFLLVLSGAATLLYWVAMRGWSIMRGDPQWSTNGVSIDFNVLNLRSVLQAPFVRSMGAIFLVALAARFFLDRYELLFDDHASLVGVDWVADHLTLPLLALNSIAALAGAVGLLIGRPKIVLLLPATLLVYSVAPALLTAVYVRPSEITIQKPYIARHIEATLSAYKLNQRATEIAYSARQEAPIDPAKHKPLLDNVRLWDWRAFHDTISQIQALRPYYVFQDSDVDRYTIDGNLRQVLGSPRELDVNQLPGDARSRWINPHFIYTHGYGMVMAEASRITKDGLPVLLIENAPPVVNTPSLQLTRPEIYFGEVTHDPVFVHTKQAEFNYPLAAMNVETHYEGKGGFPISSMSLRLAAAVSEGDWNILLTSYLTPESRMMIRRKITDRLETLAPFLEWDSDPYLVLTKAGKLVWIVDGYTISDAHPYSKSFLVGRGERINYIRNSVKATVDAYDGVVRMYVFDDKDPVLAAYRHLFPKLFTPEAEMPADVRAHARYPETIFRLQAEVYRTYHITNPEAFFNREDQWDIARNLNGPSGKPEPVNPTYVVASLPGQDKAEFLLMTTFTPRNKDNLIGIMVARCDGVALGELYFLQLPRQELIFGPMQIEARINQDQVISKDLTLWNQQGSQVLRGQMLVLPVAETLLYIEPIYIQASEARMPQMKKVVLAMGNRLMYTDTYEQALAELTGKPYAPETPASAAQTTRSAEPVKTNQLSDQVLTEFREHLRRYKELMSKGQYAEAGRELEALERLTKPH
jgi:uncharacterized protein